MAEEDVQPQDDAANFDRVQQFIKSQVQVYLNDALEQQRAQQPPPQPDQAQRQLQEVINPYVEPAIVNAVDARDETRFYRRNPQATEYESQIEGMFEELKKQGRLIPRQDIYDVIVGREFRADPQKFTEKQAAKHKEQVDHAASGVDFGAATFAKAKNDPQWANFNSLSVEEMEKALEGITF